MIIYNLTTLKRIGLVVPTAPFWARYHYSPGGRITAAETATPRLAGLAAGPGAQAYA